MISVAPFWPKATSNAPTSKQPATLAQAHRRLRCRRFFVLGVGHHDHSAAAQAKPSASAAPKDKVTGMLAYGIHATACVTERSNQASPQATAAMHPAVAGNASAAMLQRMPAVHTGPKSGPVAIFASGATRGNWENNAADRGVAKTEDANVSARASRAKAGTRGARRSIQRSMSEPNRTMPNVAKADSANEADSAASGSSAMRPAMQTDSEDNEEARRRAVQDNSPATVMTAARTAETGTAVNTR